MPYYEKSEDWLRESALLLQARPATVRSRRRPLLLASRPLTNTQTRVTTKYHLKPARRLTKEQKALAKQQVAAVPTKPPRGHLLLKTFDPQSGVALKYKTSKAAEVTRLVQMLGTLGRRMAALPEVAGAGQQHDEPMLDAEAAAAGSGTQTPVPTAASTPAAGTSGQGPQPGGGGKGRKKKGKR
ncbi:signal recognition particle 9 kDa protein-domain-containing protein [Lasiosphaeria miniovina]|uniref:Signal recognition particle 9 kDa protein-domain-containing protein n=1 Tax=Lasiosphaeria miniovina TaxID=1954250 RepID=A0AA40AW06_9PEZI|nr:signal recognition particle 9 kDa protein-domain-containing protein [Lasiosphaeria miniovina]KAK0723062.1 signal recognition particle 9 kDa protein-domain-containing protein [Lasiosphaeria miniovina]